MENTPETMQRDPSWITAAHTARRGMRNHRHPTHAVLRCGPMVGGPPERASNRQYSACQAHQASRTGWDAVADNRESWWIPALTAVTVVASAGTAMATNEFTARDTGWGFGLDIIRRNPLRWLTILVAITILAGFGIWWIQQRRAVARAQAHRSDAFTHARAMATIGEHAVPWVRQSSLNVVVDHLTTGGPVTLIVGLPGSGKTPLLEQSARCLRDRFPYALAVTFNGPAAIEPGYLLSRLNEALTSLDRGIDNQLLHRTSYERALGELAGAASDLPLLVLLDGLEQLSDDWQQRVLHTLAGLKRARVLATSCRRPPIGSPALIVNVEALTHGETIGLASAAVRALGLTVELETLLAKIRPAVAQHPQSLLLAIAQADRLPAALATQRSADTPPVSVAVEDIIRALPREDRKLLSRLLIVNGMPAETVVNLAVFTAGRGLADGAELLRSSLVEALDPVRIPAIVQSAALEAIPEMVAIAASGVVGELLTMESDILAVDAPVIAYRLAELRQYREILRICQHPQLLDHLNRVGQWDEYLAITRLGARAAQECGDDEEAAELLLRLARKLPQRGDLAGADAALQQAIAVAAGLRDAGLYGQIDSHRGMLLLYRGDVAGARLSLESALETACDPALRCVINKQLGHVYEMLGDSACALGHYRAAADGPPADRHAFEARLNIGLLHLRNDGSTPEEPGRLLLELVREAQQFSPPYPTGLSRALLAYAIFAWQNGFRKQAIQTARAALAITETDPRLRIKAVELLSRWSPPWRVLWIRPWRKLMLRLERGRAARLGRSAIENVDEYKQSLHELYSWSDGSTYQLDDVVSQARDLRDHLTSVALGTGMDHKQLESIFDKIDSRDVTMIDG